MDSIGLTIALSVTGIASFASGLWSINNFKKARYVLDTPTSKIRSAAQGYVEFYGQLSEGAGVLTAPLSAQPCVWWSLRIEEQVRNDKDRTRWQRVESGSSSELLCLNDGTADCWIDPAGAQVIAKTRVIGYGAARRPRPEQFGKSVLGPMSRGVKRYRYTEQRLHAAEPLYAIGDFFTLGGGQAEFDLQAAENQLISKWKTDFADLLQRFDGDQDGRLNEQEWQQVRSSARQLAEQSHRERSIQSPQYYLRKPQEKQPFVLSSYAEKDIAKRFKRQALVGTFFCMLSALGGAYLINTHFLVS